ncbi:MAG TPA: glycoside hydrolase family 3 C-terminal domain-containing protein [Vicinamibacteria bacterium]|nr:glycoside hydrolase family 3 C-terminal domain-containing protein [Vicinamibacteria bacterium]
MRGRDFLEEEDQPGAAPVVLLGHGLWQRQFGGADVVGQDVLLDGVPHRIVGVMPPSFRHPYRAELWVPLALRIDPVAAAGRFLYAPARLRPGVGLDEARRSMRELCARLDRQFPNPTNARYAAITPLHALLLVGLFGALGLLLSALGLYGLLSFQVARRAWTRCWHCGTSRRKIAFAVPMKTSGLVRLVVVLLLVAGVAAAQPARFEYPFQDPDRPAEERITDLISRMTLEEKIDCLAFRAAVPRLGVKGSPHIEGYHGVAQGGPSNWGRRNPTPTTQFPQAYGLGSTWDPELIRRVAAQMAQEARFLFQSETYSRSGIIVRAPQADLARDPRWGRTEEVYGEDPFHVGTLAVAFTRGLQGADPRYWKTAALLKHFLANSNEDGRESSSSDFDERLWREYYAKPFEMAVREGGSRAMMAAYNAVNGIPAHVHPMLREIVVREWGLDGIICTDGGGLRLLVTAHKAFPDLPAASAACLKAGINHFLDRHKQPVTEAVKRGLVSEAEIDEALRGPFRVSIRLGLLDPPERSPYSAIGAKHDPEPWAKPETRAFVREVTRRSIVLLKNSAGLLPLDLAKVKSLAVVGPLANQVLLDWYSGTPPYVVSPREGLERAASGGPPPAASRFGVNWVGDMSEAAVELAKRQDVAVVCVGNHPEGNAGWEVVTSPSEGKEAVDRRQITLPPGQEEFVRRVHAANPRTVVVLITNFPVALPWAAANATTILHMTHASQELGNALADVLLGDFNPGGRLAQTWPRSLADLPPMMDYDIRNGRTYMYSPAEPQYPFGYGLSYTSFTYANLRTSAPRLTASAPVTVSVDVTNSGARAGDEVVQLYVRYPESRVPRPLKQLRGFQRVTLAPGETRTVTLRLAAQDLAYWQVERHAWVTEPARVELRVGSSSSDADLKLRQVISVAP